MEYCCEKMKGHQFKGTDLQGEGFFRVTDDALDPTELGWHVIINGTCWAKILFCPFCGKELV